MLENLVQIWPIILCKRYAWPVISLACASSWTLERPRLPQHICWPANWHVCTISAQHRWVPNWKSKL